MRLPETDLTVSASRDDLVFQWVVDDVLEQRVDTQHVTTRTLPAVTYAQQYSKIVFYLMAIRFIFACFMFLRDGLKNSVGCLPAPAAVVQFILCFGFNQS